MGTLFIDRKDITIKADGEALAFYSNGAREGGAPLNPFRRVIIVGGEILIETRALHKLAEKEISVLFLSGKRLECRGTLRGKLHNNGRLRIKQYEKSLGDFPKGFATELVKQKIEGELSIINQALEQRKDLAAPLHAAKLTLEKVLGILSNEPLDEARAPMADDTTSQPTWYGVLMGYEGGAATAYFQGYTSLFADSLDFKGRQRRPPTDPVNAMLSLGYTLLHFEVLREIETIGLDPTIGFYHQFEYGRESLACDLVEPYRPEVDLFVWNLFRERTFTARDFTEGKERPGVYLKKEGRKRFYEIYETWATELRPKLTEEVRILARRILDGEDTVPLS